MRAKKSLGQNFLIDHGALTDIANSIHIRGRHIVEVGPGYGALTDYIIQADPATLDLVELDPDMIDILESKFGTRTSTTVTIHHQDILDFAVSYDTYSVIANIPYYITSPILFHFLYPMADIDHGGLPGESIFTSPEEMVIMMQKEVGEKILGGRSRKPHSSLLSLAMEQACSNIELVRYVPSTSFDPEPKVDSIVLRFSIKKDRNKLLEQELIELWKVVFLHPRKTLISNLRGSKYNTGDIVNVLDRLGYCEQVRAEAIAQGDWEMILAHTKPTSAYVKQEI